MRPAILTLPNKKAMSSPEFPREVYRGPMAKKHYCTECGLSFKPRLTNTKFPRECCLKCERQLTYIAMSPDGEPHMKPRNIIFCFRCGGESIGKRECNECKGDQPLMLV